MTAPDPVTAVVCPRLDQGGWLRIVNHNEIGIEFKPGAILLRISEKGFETFIRQVVTPAMQRVVKRFGDRKEIVAAGDYIPANRKIQFLNQRDDAVQHFSHSTAEGRRVDHLNAPSLQARG